jgi:hypothetical protein
MIARHELRPGTCIRLRAPSSLLELRADTGTVVRKDRWAEYYIVRLDKPAICHDGEPIELTEVREDIDNFDVIDESVPPARSV